MAFDISASSPLLRLVGEHCFWNTPPPPPPQLPVGVPERLMGHCGAQPVSRTTSCV